MKLPWVNGGREFVPQPALRDLLDGMEREDALEQDLERWEAEGIPPERAKRKLAMASLRNTAEAIARILSRTDPQVTVDVVLDNVRPKQAGPLYEQLATEAEAANEHGNDVEDLADLDDAPEEIEVEADSP